MMISIERDTGHNDWQKSSGTVMLMTMSVVCNIAESAVCMT